MNDAAVGMTTAGWVFLGVAWGGVLSFAMFCLSRVIAKRNSPPPDDAGEGGEDG